MFQNFASFVKLVVTVEKFVSSPEGQKLIADLKEIGAQVVTEAKAVEADLEAAKAAATK